MKKVRARKLLDYRVETISQQCWNDGRPPVRLFMNTTTLHDEVDETATRIEWRDDM